MSSPISLHQDSESAASAATPAVQRGRGNGSSALGLDGQIEAAESPRPVTRGESLENTEKDHANDHSKTPHPYSAFTDWLTVTFPFMPSRIAIAQFKNNLCDVIGLALGGMKERKAGIDGFETSYAFDHFGALFAYGGKSQAGRAMLKLTGEACATIPDWHGLALHLERALGARITRWDGAVDCIEGQHTVDEAAGWFATGGFNAGGNQPKHQCWGPWLLPSYEGRTLYIGDRKKRQTYAHLRKRQAA
jgi:phage replication initiation protein